MTRTKDSQLINKYRTALMGMAALLIVFFHEWQPIAGTMPVLSDIEAFVKRLGFVGVDIFFLLSGMGLNRSIEQRSLGEYYFRRFKRLIMPFIFTALIYSFLKHWTLVEFICNISGISFYAKNIYSFLWFVPAIATLYLVFPLYHLVLSKQKNKGVFTGLFIASWILLLYLLRDTLRQDLYGFLNRIPIFVTGVCLGDFLKNERNWPTIVWLSLISMLIAGNYLAYLCNFQGVYLIVPESNCLIPTYLISCSLPFLIAKILDIIHLENVIRVLAFYGVISFEFYCLQEGIGGYIIPKLNMHPLFINIFILLIITISSLVLKKICDQIWSFVDRRIAKK